MLVPNDNMKKLLENRLQEYGRQFEVSPEASIYWEERGLTKEVRSEFRVGYVAEPLKGDARFQGCIAIPYIAANDRVVGYKFRRIDNNPQRFLKDKGEPNRIFNTRILRRARKVVITEGELDCVAATQAGLQAVGIPGANNWKPEWNRVFYNRQLTVLADGDEAGHDFAEMVATKLYGVRIIDLPAGEDVNSILLQKGSEYIRDLVVS